MQAIGKTCRKCNETKDLSLFYRDRNGKYGVKSKCKSCLSAYDKTRQELRLEKSKQWYQRNKQRILLEKKEQRLNNPEIFREREKSYYKNNYDKILLKNERRRLRLKQATPTWLSEEQIRKMKLKYEVAKRLSIIENKQYSVDHIYPIYNQDFCGLNVPWNLQILTVKQNSEKGCRYG